VYLPLSLGTSDLRMRVNRNSVRELKIMTSIYESAKTRKTLRLLKRGLNFLHPYKNAKTFAI
jgi:hypothetical protein